MMSLIEYGRFFQDGNLGWAFLACVHGEETILESHLRVYLENRAWEKRDISLVDATKVPTI